MADNYDDTTDVVGKKCHLSYHDIARLVPRKSIQPSIFFFVAVLFLSRNALLLHTHPLLQMIQRPLRL